MGALHGCHAVKFDFSKYCYHQLLSCNVTAVCEWNDLLLLFSNQLLLLLFFYTWGIKHLSGFRKNCYKEQEICLEGQASSSGFLGKVPLNAIKLKHCIQTDRGWKRKAVSHLSPTITNNPIHLGIPEANYYYCHHHHHHCDDVYSANRSYLFNLTSR